MAMASRDNFRLVETDLPAPGPGRVPEGISIFPRELFRSTRRFAERLYPVLNYWNELPDLFVEELCTCFRRPEARNV